MTAFFALTRKKVGESRWLLALSALALFGLSWLTVYVTGRIERSLNELGDPARAARRGGFLRGMGGAAMDFSTLAIEVSWWNHPFIILLVAMWAIARGSIAVAGELERGTLDVILSRPIRRSGYLFSQVFIAVLGLLALVGALLAGNQVGAFYNKLNDPPALLALSRPALNLASFGWALFGVTLFFSSMDVVRWRSNLIAGTFTLGSFILLVVVNAPTLEDYKWLERYSIFKAYNPVEAAVKGESLAFNAGILGLIGLVGVVLALIVFNRRDLPATGG